MYKIMKNGKRFNTKTYGSYEEARKYAVRKVRQVTGEGFDPVSKRNIYPALSDMGFSIKRIEG